MTRKNNPQETIESIISVSMQLFNEKGFEKTSMQDIIDASGFSKGAIFYHFKSKEEIFEEAMEKQYEVVKTMMQKWYDEMVGLNAREKLIRLIEYSIHDNELNATNEEMMKIGSVSPHLVVAHMKRNITHGAPVMAKVIHEGIADGSIVCEFPDECAELFMHLANYWCDPVLFDCDLETCGRRLRCLQQIMKDMGVDIMTEEIYDHTMRITEIMLNNIQQNR